MMNLRKADASFSQMWSGVVVWERSLMFDQLRLYPLAAASEATLRDRANQT